MMELEIGKIYLTISGCKVRILATDIKNENYPIIGALSFNNNEEEILSWTKEGKIYKSSSEVNKDDLISEYSFWNDVKVDTKVLVRNYDSDEWVKRYFAKYQDGHVYVYDFGATSWTVHEVESNSFHRDNRWRYAKLYNENDELQNQQ